MTDINKLCDELEALLKAEREASTSGEYAYYAGEVNSKFRNAARPLIDVARESVKQDANYIALQRANQEIVNSFCEFTDKLSERVKELEQPAKERGK